MTMSVEGASRRSTGPALTQHLRMEGCTAQAHTLRCSRVTVTPASYQRGSTGQGGLTAPTLVGGEGEPGNLLFFSFIYDMLSYFRQTLCGMVNPITTSSTEATQSDIAT